MHRAPFVRRLGLLSLFGLLLGLTLALAVSSRPVAASLGTLSDNPDPDAWVTNGQVHAVERTADATYIGGNFSMVGPYSGSGVVVSKSTYERDESVALVAGEVRASVPDGSGGWFIGGAFSTVGGVARPYLAHLSADGSLDTSWDSATDATVGALWLEGSTLYVGGDFSTCGGQARDRLAALDAATGTATAWDPGADAYVHEIVVDGATVYVSGEFNNTGGSARDYIAALDATTGAATAWNPAADSFVYALAVDGSSVFAGGDYSTIGGQPRGSIAELSVATGLATSWNPGADGQINDLVVDGATLYVAGGFTTIGGAGRNRAAALDTTTGTPSAWDPDADAPVEALLLDGATTYLGGQFVTVGGQDHRYLAAVSTSTGTPIAWGLQAGFPVSTFSHSTASLFVGGSFTFVEGVDRNSAAAFSNSTGLPTTWDPNADFTVRTLDVDGATVYVGGNFNTIGGQTRNYVAALDATTGAASSWDPDASAAVFSIVSSGSTVYVGGQFATVGGQPRDNIAALDAATGLATSWNPDAGNYVYKLKEDGTTIYAAGIFSTIGGQTRNRVAALDAGTGLATSWNPNADGDVWDVEVDGSTVYVSGGFANVGGAARGGVAALDATSGLASSWNPNTDGIVNALAVDGTTVYLGGSFLNVGGQGRTRLASVDAGTGTVSTWNPVSANSILELTVAGDILHVGGVTAGLGDFGHGWGYNRFLTPTVEFDQTGTSVAESATTVDAPIALSSKSYDTTTVDISIAGGTAVAGQDFNLTSTTATIQPLCRCVTVPVTIIDDAAVEPTETVTFTLTNPSTYVALGMTTSYTLTITDSDAAAALTNVERVPGDTPATQAINLSKERFPVDGSAACGVLARQDLMVDAFVVGPLANLQHCTVLLTSPSGLSPEALGELNRALGSTTERIYLTGGTLALSDQVEQGLAAAGYTTRQRFAGTNRRHTARLVADEVAARNTSPAQTVMVTEDTALVDALTIAAVAGRAGDGTVEPILITARRSNSVDPNLAAFLQAHPEVTHVRLVGGTTALTPALEAALRGAFPATTVVRSAGSDRYATNLAVVAEFYAAPTALAVAGGEPGAIVGAASVSSQPARSLYAALLSGPLAGDLGVPLLLVRSNEVPSATRAYIVANAATLTTVYVVGSPAQVSPAVESELASLL